MSEEIKFTKEQIDYIKHCGEHFEVLTGGRGHSKTKQIIEQLQQENQQLKLDFDLYNDNHIYKNYEVERKDKQLDLYKEVIEEVMKILNNQINYREYVDIINAIEEVLDKVKGE